MRATAFITVVALGVCALAPMTAWAAIVGDNQQAIAPDQAQLSIPVTASIGNYCGTTTLPTTLVHLGDLTLALSTQVAMTIQCNGAFRMGVQSQNGGMLLGAPGSAPSGYTNLRDYDVTLNIVDNSNVTHTSSTCHASTLTATAALPCTNLIGPASNSAPGFLVSTASTGKASNLTISGAYTGSDILMSSNGVANYGDILVITLSAAT